MTFVAIHYYIEKYMVAPSIISKWDSSAFEAARLKHLRDLGLDVIFGLI